MICSSWYSTYCVHSLTCCWVRVKSTVYRIKAMSLIPLIHVIHDYLEFIFECSYLAILSLGASSLIMCRILQNSSIDFSSCSISSSKSEYGGHLFSCLELNRWKFLWILYIDVVVEVQALAVHSCFFSFSSFADYFSRPPSLAGVVCMRLLGCPLLSCLWRFLLRRAVPFFFGCHPWYDYSNCPSSPNEICNSLILTY